MPFKKSSEKTRCGWSKTWDDPLYRNYHDDEWGVPIHDDRKIFEFLVLESFQAGLSWAIVLRKRENFRKAFAKFDPIKVTKFNAKDLKRLVGDAGIIRNRLKIEAAINNAKRFLEVQKEFGTFAKYSWGFVGGKPLRNKWKTMHDLPAKTAIAETWAVDLKKRGFKFLGPTVIYAHMQATGMVNDHAVDCFRHKEVTSL